MPSDSEDRDFSRTAIAEAEAEIEQARAEVAVQISTLHHEIADTLHWSHWFRRHPAAFIATALGLGYVIGRRLPQVTRRR